MNRTHQLKYYIKHLLTAKNRGGHGIHSPFLYDFIQHVILEKHPFYCFESIEKQRINLVSNSTHIEIPGDKAEEKRLLRISNLARQQLTPARKNQLLFRICARYHFKKVVEIGTSLGISTLYLSSSDSRLTCISIEVNESMAGLVKEQLEKAGKTNARVLTIDSSSGLQELLGSAGVQDLIYISALQSSLRVTEYFNCCVNFIHNNSIIVIDSPYRSVDASSAWQSIKNHPGVHASMDLYTLGIVFFNPAFANKHYKVIF